MRACRYLPSADWCFSILLRRRASAAAAGALLLSGLATPAATVRAQGTSAFVACTPGVLQNCAELRLTSSAGLFELALRNLGSTATPALPTSVYNLVLGTGRPAAAPGTEVSALMSPVPVGGATLTDASAWDAFEAGDALFLSALTNLGVGGCVAGAPVGGFGQAGRTCGAGEYLTFTFWTPRLFDPAAFTVLNLEVVGLAPDLPADSCGGVEAPCAIRAVDSTVPEPATLALTAIGVLSLACLRARCARGSRYARARDGSSTSVRRSNT